MHSEPLSHIAVACLATAALAVIRCYWSLAALPEWVSSELVSPELALIGIAAGY
jgi:hypothetical protein